MTTKLEQVFNYILNGDAEKAKETLHAHLLAESALIHQRIVEDEEDIEDMNRDLDMDMCDDLISDITDDQESIDAEETLSDEDAVEDLALDMAPEEDELFNLEDLEDDFEELHNEVDAVKNDVEEIKDEHEDMESEFDKLAAEFDALMADEEVEHADVDADVVDGEEGEEALEESQLKPVSFTPKDESKKAASAVPKKGKDLDLGGKPVKQEGPTASGYARKDVTVPKVTTATNTSMSAQILKAAKIDSKDKAPGAGGSPAMPKKSK